MCVNGSAPLREDLTRQGIALHLQHQLGQRSLLVRLRAYSQWMGVNEQQAMGNKKPSQNWDDVRYFLAVARTGTLSAAAMQLGTEHTTVARHIQALEDELNSRLFHKSHAGYELTDAGERLLVGAEAIESAYVSAKAAASSEGHPITGTVRIGAPDGFGSVFMMRPARPPPDRHPNLVTAILETP